LDELNTACEEEGVDYGENLMGTIEHPTAIPLSILNKHHRFFAAFAQEYHDKQYADEPRDLRISAGWFLRMRRADDFNPAHCHTQSNLSSVGYLKLPDNFDDVCAENPYQGRLQFIDGANREYVQATHTITPEVGDFYVFPSWLMHTVYPTKEPLIGERRSFSINFQARMRTKLRQT
jgi:uncharacterized protein (TIGR02466 family)